MDEQTQARIDRLIAAQESLVLTLAQLAESIAMLANAMTDDHEPEPAEPSYGSLDN